MINDTFFASFANLHKLVMLHLCACKLYVRFCIHSTFENISRLFLLNIGKFYLFYIKMEWHGDSNASSSPEPTHRYVHI